jgi:hypothetical protein
MVRAEGRRCHIVRQEGMIAMVILGPFEFHGAIDAWTEYLCMEPVAGRQSRTIQPLARVARLWG